VLAAGGGVVESEGVGDDGGGDLEDELGQGGDAGGAQGQAEGAELVGHRVAGGGLAGLAAGEQPSAGVVGGDVVVALKGESREAPAGTSARSRPGQALVCLS
jgi:hypothetical protein